MKYKIEPKIIGKITLEGKDKLLSVGLDLIGLAYLLFLIF
jgi:hypothetical protein